WTKPRRIVVPNLMPAGLAQLKRVAPDVEFIPVKTAADATKAVADADAVLGFCTAEIVKAGTKLRWIHAGHAGVDRELSSEVIASPVVLTNLQRLYGPNASDQAFALLLTLTRGVREGPSKGTPQELYGKTMLVVGLGGTGTAISRRAHAFGMRV